MILETTMSESQTNVTRLFNIKDELVRLTAATPKSMPTRMLKLTNETGELAGAVDIAEGNAGTKYRQVTDPIADVLEEAIDVSLVVSSMIVQLMVDHNIPITHVMSVIEQKMAKWSKVLELDNDPTNN